MSNFQSATGLLGTVFVAGTTLVGLKIATDFIGNAVNNTQKSLPKSSKKSKNNYNKMFGYSKKTKYNDFFDIKF